MRGDVVAFREQPAKMKLQRSSLFLNLYTFHATQLTAQRGTAKMLGSDVAHLVALLKESPFELHHLTGPRLGELGGEETRRLAVDVFSKLSPPGSFHGSATGGTLAEEGAQTTAMLLEFLKHVRYVPEDIDDAAARKGWALGDHDVVLPALKWVLDNRVRCEKRAYVGHFMADYVVPGEYAMDPEIQDLMNNTHESQRAFVEAHRECEAARKEAKDPIKLKSQISDLEREREQVERRIAVTKGKVAQRVTDPRELEELVALASSLREEQAQEHELARQTRDQVERRDLADQRRNRAASRTRELRASLASGSPTALLQQLADEVAQRKTLVEEKLPGDLAVKTRRLESVKEILLSDVRTDSDIAAQTSEVNKLAAEVRELEDGLQEAIAARDGDVQLRQQAQVAKTIAAKRQSAVAKRDRLLQRRNQVVGEYESASARQEGDQSTTNANPDEMKAKFESVKAKLVRYKQLKRELDELNMEAAVLARTEQILAGELVMTPSEAWQMPRRPRGSIVYARRVRPRRRWRSGVRRTAEVEVRQRRVRLESLRNRRRARIPDAVVCRTFTPHGSTSSSSSPQHPTQPQPQGCIRYTRHPRHHHPHPPSHTAPRHTERDRERARRSGLTLKRQQQPTTSPQHQQPHQP